VAAWHSGNGVVYINKVALRRAGLVLSWATICMYVISVSNRPLRPTQPPILGRIGNEYWSMGSGWEGNRRSESHQSYVINSVVCPPTGSVA